MKGLLLFGLVLGSLVVHGQCTIEGWSDRLSLTCGDSTYLNAFGSSVGQILLDEDFNTGAFGEGWDATPGAVDFSNPCSGGGVDGTPHAWMGNNTSVPRTLTSESFDLTMATAGVSVCFDLMFATQGQSSPCEGPDEPDEGVYLQYSIDGGLTWTTIHFFNPNGGNDSEMVNWNNWCFELPAEAITNSTIIRWNQDADSGQDYDHWGIDNVFIYQMDYDSEITWLHDGYSYGIDSEGGQNPNAVSPTTTTIYTVQMTTGMGSVCTNEVEIEVLPLIYDVSLTSEFTLNCEDECVDIEGTASILADPGGLEVYENTDTIAVVEGQVQSEILVNGLNVTNISDGLIAGVNLFGFDFQDSFTCGNIFGCSCEGGNVSYNNTCYMDAANFEVKLITPDGCEIILAPKLAANGPYINTIFVPVGGAVFDNNFPNGGTWNPEESFSNLNGCNPNGIWSLVLSSNMEGGSGQISGWSISFNDEAIYHVPVYNWDNPSVLSNPDSLDNTICPINSMSLNLTVSNGVLGCPIHEEQIEIEVEECPCEAPVLIAVDSVICEGESLDLSELIVSDYTGYELSFYAEENTAMDGVDEINMIVNETGNYYIRLQEPGEECYTLEMVYVEVQLFENAEFEMSSFCYGEEQEIILPVSNGNFSLVDNLNNQAEINPISGVISGYQEGDTYFVQFQTSGICPSSFTQQIYVYSLPSPEIIGSSMVCEGDSIILSTNNAYENYYWSDQSTQSTLEIFGSTSVSVQVEDQNGCLAESEEFTVEEVASIIKDSLLEICEGSTVFIFGNYVEEEGVYSEVFTASSGCDSVVNVTLVINDNPSVNVVKYQLESCLGDNNGSIEIADVSGSGEYSFMWDITPDPQTALITNLPPNEYQVSIMDINTGCSIDTVLTLEAGPVCCDMELDSLILTNPTCNNDDGEVDMFVSGGSGNYLFELENQENENGSFNGLASGDFNLTITDLDNLCEIDTTFSLELPSGPEITSISTEDVLCFASNEGSVEIEVISGLPEYSVSIINGNFLEENTNGYFNGLYAGNYTYNIIDQNNCFIEGGFTIREPEPLIFSLFSTDLSCADDFSGRIEIEVSGGEGEYIYTMDDFQNNQNQNWYDGLSAGEYVVNVADANDCLGEPQMVEVLSPEPVVLNVEKEDESCYLVCDGRLNWGATGGVGDYTFRVNNAVETQGSLSGLCPETFYVVVEDANYCTDQDTIEINPALALMFVEKEVVDETCPGTCDGSLSLLANQSVSYWLNGVQSQDGYFDALCEGEYEVQIENVNGCKVIDSVEVLKPAPVVANFELSDSILSVYETLVDISNWSQNANFFEWNVSSTQGFTDVFSGDLSNLQFPNQPGSYEVCLTAENENGCIDTTCKLLEIMDEFNLFVPNAFTPDGDLINDQFQVFISDLSNYQFEIWIYDRWGEVVFNSSHPNNSWDGSIQGNDAQEDVYVWKIKLNSEEKQEKKVYVGHVTLIR